MAIGGGEAAPLAQRNAEHAEVVGADHPVVRIGRIPGDHPVHEEGGRREIAVHRHDVGGRRAPNPGDRREAGLHLVVEALDRGPPVVPGAWQRQPDGQNLRRTEAWIDGLHLLEAARQDCGAHQQHRRERDFREHEQRAHTAAAEAGPSSAALERAAKIPPPDLHRRRESDQDAGPKRRQQGEAGGRPPDPDLRHTRQVRWPDREERRNQHSRDQKAGGTAKDAENRRFAQHVPDDARARGTERGPHRQFPLPRCGADEKEVGQVGARDQQDDDDGAEQHPEHGRRPAADLVVQPGHPYRGVGAMRVRVLVTQPPPDPGEIVGRL